MLWRIISGHEEGVCDSMCNDFDDIASTIQGKQELLDWLEDNEYLKSFASENAWGLPIKQYKLNWATVNERLGIGPPPPFKPLSMRLQSLKEISQ